MKLALRPIDVIAAVVGMLLIGALSHYRGHDSWGHSAVVAVLFGVFLLALYIWTNRRRELHNAKVRAQHDEDQRGR